MAGMKPLTVRYAYDSDLQTTANARGDNYWYAYVAEILSRLGVCAKRAELAACADPATLRDTAVLLLGDFASEHLPDGMAAAVETWLADGGVLIGFATRGLDNVFGIAGEHDIAQSPDPFSIGGYFDLCADAVTTGCRADIEPDQKLIAISPLRVVRLQDATTLARLFLPDPCRPANGALATDLNRPAITHRKAGAGHAFYFAFNVAQTMWGLQQGRPVDADHDGDGYLRVSDACVIGENSRAVPYADALHFLLGNMIGRRPVPMIHQIPPRDGQIAPALFFFGGDDEGVPNNQLFASDFMAARGLPYHINAMPRADGTFAFDEEEQRRIEANGHEIALHYDFISAFQHPTGFTSEDIERQAALFRERFGHDSVCSVTHWCRWSGWAEPARWRAACGERADNSYICWTSPPLNPVNRIGFSFGSAFPRYFWDDAAHGNARIEFMELPIVGYEIGYEEQEPCFGKIHEALNLACRYHLTFNLFWHPVRIEQFEGCRLAVDEFVRLVGEMPNAPVLMGCDQLCDWWSARDQAVVEGATSDGRTLRFEAECDFADGVVVKVPTGDSPATAGSLDGVAAALKVGCEFGQHWAFVPLTTGRHTVVLELG